jgi:hypothetical protein
VVLGQFEQGFATQLTLYLSYLNPYCMGRITAFFQRIFKFTYYDKSTLERLEGQATFKFRAFWSVRGGKWLNSGDSCYFCILNNPKMLPVVRFLGPSVSGSLVVCRHFEEKYVFIDFVRTLWYHIVIGL